MDKFSARHFAFLILGVAIVSLKTYPGIFFKDGGRESWIAVIIASVLVLLIFMTIIHISEKNNRPNLCQVYQGALGKTFGNLMIFIFMGTMIVTLVECSSVETSAMHENMMIETPKWYFLLFFIIPCMYIVFKDIVAIVIVTVIGIILKIIAGLNLVILTSRYKDFHLLFPIFNDGLTTGFLICIVKILGLYGSVSIILPYIYMIADHKKKMINSSIIGLLFVIQMHIVSISGLVMTFEIGRLKNINFPKLVQTQLISYSQFIEFGELFVMLQILGGWIVKYVITFYGIFLILSNLNVKKKYLKFTLFILSGIVFISSYFASKNLFILFKLLNAYAYLCLFNFLFVPFIVYIIFHYRNRASTGEL